MSVLMGSMFSGVGGLDLAAEVGLSGRTLWQIDKTGDEVRRRHWPDTLQIASDIAAVDPGTLESVDVLVGGFPCTDLSTAGTHLGLDGERSGLYRHLLRFTDALAPSLVLIENVPRLLSKHRGDLIRDWWAMGYGLTWVKCRALDAGSPQVRNRVFVIAERGRNFDRVLEVDRAGAWQPTDGSRPWPTPTASEPNAAESLETWRARSAALVARGSRPLSEPLGMAARGRLGDRVSADWLEVLMGFPSGWTYPIGLCQRWDALDRMSHPRWPRGRYPKDEDRAQWDGYCWEPVRAFGGPPVPGRPARVRALGNAVCPQQGALALARWQS